MSALTPSFDAFANAYEAGRNQLVYTRLAADLDTPVSLMLKLTGAAKDAFVLESVTWRASADWGERMGYSRKQLRERATLGIERRADQLQ